MYTQYGCKGQKLKTLRFKVSHRFHSRTTECLCMHCCYPIVGQPVPFPIRILKSGLILVHASSMFCSWECVCAHNHLNRKLDGRTDRGSLISLLAYQTSGKIRNEPYRPALRHPRRTALQKFGGSSTIESFRLGCTTIEYPDTTDDLHKPYLLNEGTGAIEVGFVTRVDDVVESSLVPVPTPGKRKRGRKPATTEEAVSPKPRVSAHEMYNRKKKSESEMMLANVNRMIRSMRKRGKANMIENELAASERPKTVPKALTALGVSLKVKK